MAITTITAIPHNGGTLNLARKDLCSVTLSATKTVNFYAQSNPNLVYAHVVVTAGLNGSVAATSTNGPQFAFGAGGARVRALKLTESRMLVLLGNDLVVMEVASDNTITQKAGVLAGFNGAGALWQSSPTLTEQSDSFLLGSLISGTRLTDNTAVYFNRSSNYYSLPTMKVVTYNPTTEALTVTNTSPLVNNSHWNDTQAFNGGHFDFRFSDIPNSTNKLFYIVASNNNTANLRSQQTPYVMSAFVMNQNAQFIRTLSSGGTQNASNYTASTQPFHAIVALSDSVFLALQDGKSMRVMTNNVAYAPTTNPPAGATGTFSSSLPFATSGAQSMVSDVVALNDSYFMLAMTDPVATSYPDAANMKLKQQYLRVVRYVDQNFAEVVSSTENYTANPLGILLNFDGNYGFEKIDATTYVFKSKLNGTATDARINIRSIVAGS